MNASLSRKFKKLTSVLGLTSALTVIFSITALAESVQAPSILRLNAPQQDQLKLPQLNDVPWLRHWPSATSDQLRPWLGPTQLQNWPSLRLSPQCTPSICFGKQRIEQAQDSVS